MGYASRQLARDLFYLFESMIDQRRPILNDLTGRPSYSTRLYSSLTMLEMKLEKTMRKKL